MNDIVKRLRNPIRIKTDYGLELDRREAADRIEQLEALLRVMPGYGLSAYDKERWEKARNAFLASDSAPACHIAEDTKLWLWRNGDHFLAFEHLYPCFTPGGDPMTLGEPAGWAVFRRSFDRAARSASGEGEK